MNWSALALGGQFLPGCAGGEGRLPAGWRATIASLTGDEPKDYPVVGEQFFMINSAVGDGR
jgi:hypothetical protein